MFPIRDTFSHSVTNTIYESDVLRQAATLADESLRPRAFGLLPGQVALAAVCTYHAMCKQFRVLHKARTDGGAMLPSVPHAVWRSFDANSIQTMMTFVHVQVQTKWDENNVEYHHLPGPILAVFQAHYVGPAEHGGGPRR